MTTNSKRKHPSRLEPSPAVEGASSDEEVERHLPRDQEFSIQRLHALTSLETVAGPEGRPRAIPSASRPTMDPSILRTPTQSCQHSQLATDNTLRHDIPCDPRQPVPIITPFRSSRSVSYAALSAESESQSGNGVSCHPPSRIGGSASPTFLRPRRDGSRGRRPRTAGPRPAGHTSADLRPHEALDLVRIPHGLAVPQDEDPCRLRGRSA